MMHKVNVNGLQAHTVFKYLKKLTGQSAITWNFGEPNDGMPLKVLNRRTLFCASKLCFSDTFINCIAVSSATYFVVAPNGKITAHNGVEPMDLLQYSLDLLEGDEL